MNSLEQQSQTYLDNGNADIKAFTLEALKLLPKGYGCSARIECLVYLAGNSRMEFTIIPLTGDHENYYRAITGATKEECLSKIPNAVKFHELSKNHLNDKTT